MVASSIIFCDNDCDIPEPNEITKRNKTKLMPGSYKGKVIGSLGREDIYNDR